MQPIITGAVGRPSFDVSPHQLSFLIENGFSVPQISNMIGVSIRTVCRRMSEFGLSVRAQYSTIADDELDRLVSEFQAQYPLCGKQADAWTPTFTRLSYTTTSCTRISKKSRSRWSNFKTPACPKLKRIFSTCPSFTVPHRWLPQTHTV